LQRGGLCRGIRRDRLDRLAVDLRALDGEVSALIVTRSVARATCTSIEVRPASVSAVESGSTWMS